MKTCETCGWFDGWFSTCILFLRETTSENDTCDKWESFEDPEPEEEEDE